MIAVVRMLLKIVYILVDISLSKAGLGSEGCTRGKRAEVRGEGGVRREGGGGRERGGLQAPRRRRGRL